MVLLAKLVTGEPARDVAPLLDDVIVDEIALAMSAGTDTTGLVLSYALYKLVCHRQRHERLGVELANVSSASVAPAKAVAADAVATWLFQTTLLATPPNETRKMAWMRLKRQRLWIAAARATAASGGNCPTW